MFIRMIVDTICMLKDEYKVGEYFYDPRDGGETSVWTIRLEDAKDGSDSWFDCETQYEAEVLSRLVKINIALDKLPR